MVNLAKKREEMVLKKESGSLKGSNSPKNNNPKKVFYNSRVFEGKMGGDRTNKV
ncbi:MAG: hypothetical protein KKA79_02220 [Nanoarchaeota archaeon]|nr:hypothetical protein [Nanoarchaeota archaeon]